MLPLALLVFAQQGPSTVGGPVSDADPSQDARPSAEAPAARVAWYTSWEQGLAEAERLNRPILLQSAAPQCGGVPGMW